MNKIAVSAVGLAIVIVAAALVLQPTPTAAQDKPAYIGTEACSGCHKAVYDKWLLTPHRRTLADGRKPDESGCEACHGPGGAHVAGGGDKTKIVRLAMLDSRALAEICLKCHRQQEVMLYRTGLHASAKVKCTDCHDVHESGHPTMLRAIDSKQNSIKGLDQKIEEARQRLGIASTDKDKSKALDEIKKLEKKRADLTAALDSPENRNRRATESELCFSCHKDQQVQFNLPTHHPIREGKMDCSGCHNAHGGPRGNLKEESVNQTCFKCHSEMAGPYVFEHPPVEEDCSICHRPHGSAQNRLLRQSEPFLCMKCHAGPHSRSSTFTRGDTLTSSSRVPNYYWQCTSCHNRPHGSDRHGAFHY